MSRASNDIIPMSPIQLDVDVDVDKARTHIPLVRNSAVGVAISNP